MKRYQSLAIAGAMLAGIALFTAQAVLAQGSGQGMGMSHESTNHASGAIKGHSMAGIHGGMAAMTPHHRFEALFLQDGLRLYVYDADGKPVMNLEGAAATVTLQPKDSKARSVTLHVLSPDEKAGRSQPCLAASYDFGDMKAGKMRAGFEVKGLAKDAVAFQMPVSMMHQPLYTCSMHPDVRAEDPGKCGECGMNLMPMDAGKMDSGTHESGDMHPGHDGM